jgi:site-specific recombinase XerD
LHICYIIKTNYYGRNKKNFIQETTLRNFSIRTKDSYWLSASRFIKFSNQYPELTDAEILRYYFQSKFESGNYKPGTIKLEYFALKFLFTKILHKRWPKKHLPTIKRSITLPVVLSQNEVAEIINAIKNLRQRTIIMFIYSTGTRISECIKIKLSDLDISRMQLNIREGKGRKPRIVPISPLMLLVLYKYIEVYKPQVYLFEKLNYAGFPIRQVHVQRICIQTRKATRSIFKKYTPHTFRHSYATHLLENGTNILIIQKLLGHANITDTLKYIHIQQLTAEQVANPLDNLTGLKNILLEENVKLNLK